MRRGELAGLRFKDLDFHQKQIVVCSTRDRHGHRQRTKSGKVRQVPMSDLVYEVLLSLRNQSTANDYVFTGRDGEPLEIHHVYRVLLRATKKAGIDNVITFHDLRHTFASQFMMNGGNIYDLQKILGHSKTDMTQIYAHLSPDHLQRASNIISFGKDLMEDVGDGLKKSNLSQIYPKK